MPAGGTSGGGASAGAVRAGGAFVELFTKNNLLIKGLAQAKAMVLQFGAFVAKTGTKMIGIGAALLAPFAALGDRGWISQESSDNAQMMSKALDDIASTVQTALLPAFKAFAMTLQAVAKFTSDNPKLVQWVAGIGAGLIAAGVAAKVFGAAIAVAVPALSLLFSPTGLIVAGIAAAAAGFIAFNGSARGSFDGLVGIATTALDGITAAISKGDLGGALAIACEGMKAIWLQLIVFMTQQWNKFGGTVVDTIDGITTAMAKIAIKAGNGNINRALVLAAPPLGILANLLGGNNDPNAALAGLDDDFNRGVKERQRARNADLKAAQDALAESMKKLNAITADAVLPLKAPLTGGGEGANPLQLMQAGLGDAVKGAFQSSNFGQRLGIGDKVNEKMLRVQQAILDAVKALTDVVKNGKGLTFVGSKL